MAKQWYVKIHRYSARWDSNVRRYVPEHFTGVSGNLGPFGSQEMAERAEHIALASIHPNRNRPIVVHSQMMKYRMDNTNPEPQFATITHVHSMGF